MDSQNPQIADRRERLTAICLAFPEVEVSGEPHLVFRVRGKSFVYYRNNHHGDGRIAMCCKVTPGSLDALVSMDPERFFRPAYLGAMGWVALRLDTPTVDWGEVRDLAETAYRLAAPRRLAALLD